MRTTTRGVISLQQLQEDFSSVETILREDGEVTVITESGFAFKMSVMNYNDLIRTEEQKKKKMTLPEAIKRVLLAGPQEGMHSVDIAKEITANEFYFKKDGSFVDGKQVRSCANNNSDIFVCLPGNMIKLIIKNRTVTPKASELELQELMKLGEA